SFLLIYRVLSIQSVRRGGQILAMSVALLLALPIVIVAGSVLQPGGDAWRHIADTLLARYTANTALLVALVACGVMSIGVVSAWLVANYRFPGVRVLEWALVLPLAVPAYVMAYAYTDWLQVAGPVQGALRSLTRWRAARPSCSRSRCIPTCTSSRAPRSASCRAAPSKRGASRGIPPGAASGAWRWRPRGPPGGAGTPPRAWEPPPAFG